MKSATLTVLGSGTSMGVPTIGCGCPVCRSADAHDKRTRPSLLVQYDGHSVVIDTTPDFRTQALRVDLKRLDAVLFTHAHADHILGLDDIRPFNFHQKGKIPIYGSRATVQVIQSVFRYIFESEDPVSAIPLVDVHLIEGPIDLFGIDFIPIPVMHGQMEVLGFRFGRVDYLTDFSTIPDTSLPLLEDLDILFLDALRHTPHATHCTVAQALEYVDSLRPRRAFFTHISHDLGHEQTNAQLPGHVRLSYDGLTLPVTLPGTESR
jgi:phosphoribosyl 1,2-cyclic phosphate phosphodiesterase